MCRIFGHFGERAASASDLRRAAELQFHGGPDSCHVITRGNWSLGCNRLAIQGVNGGQQPFSIEDKIFVVFKNPLRVAPLPPSGELIRQIHSRV